MSLPVSQYEALLAEVRGLRRKAQRVQQLARPLIGENSQYLQNDKPLDYTMESLLLHRQHEKSITSNYERGSTSDQDQISSEDEFRINRDDFSRSTGEMSASSEPLTRGTGKPCTDSMYHGAWPNVERTTLWNSEPSCLGEAGTYQQKKDLNISGVSSQNEVSSVMSFASSSGGVPIDRTLYNPDRKCSSQQLEAKMDVVNSLLSMLGSQEHVDMGETLLALSTCPESCLAMRQSGCIPLLVQLVQSDKDSDTRTKAAQALHNLVYSQPDERVRKREIRILKLLDDVRRYIECLKYNLDYEIELSGNMSLEQIEEGDGGKHPVQTIAHLMKLSFDEGHRQAICQLGGIYTIATLVETEHSLHGCTALEGQCILMRRYACMALTNLTFGDSGNKTLLCSFRGFMRTLILQLESPSDELRQVTASVLRNLSWRAESTSKEILREVGSVSGLMKAAMLQNKENTLKSILSALWNLSAHCTENKSEICAVERGLGFLVSMLMYKTPSKSLAIIENAGGIIKNISSQIAVRDDYREILRKHNCLHILLDQLKSPSLTIVSNACGTLWNLSAKNAQDQDLLWQMGAPAMLRSLNHSKHKIIAMGSSAALKNLLSSRPQHNLMLKIDSTALSLNLPELPTLGARKQKALMQDLDNTLSETYDNIDKDSPVRFSSENNEDIGKHIKGIRSIGRSNSPCELSNTFASLNINEPSTSYSFDLRSKSKISQGYGGSSLPYVPQPTRRSNPTSYLPVRSKFSDHKYEDDTSEKPIDYSRKYTEQIVSKQRTIATSSEVGQIKSVVTFADKKDNENFNIGYTETDLDQPTDYSLRYAEDDSDSDICTQGKQEYIQDTVKTYCTEGTPYETPFVFSNATSMSDLRNVGNTDEKPEIDNDLQKNIDKKEKKEIKNVDEKDRCSTEDISEMDNIQIKHPKSEFSSGLMSPEKPVNYCEEGTPGYFSRVSSFGSGLDSVPANETAIKKEVKEVHLIESSSRQNLNKNIEDKTTSTPKTPSETKIVKFEQVVNFAEQTPLMFSRSSSLASLDSIEQHSIHDDRSSIVSDFSRLTSGIVSPSELPDSPTQTIPSSPRSSKQKIDFPSSSKQSKGITEHKPKHLQKSSVFEDNITRFKEESTPIQFSTATSLSSLTIDDHEDTENSISPVKTPETKVFQPSNNSEVNEHSAELVDQPEKKDVEKEKETSGSDLNDDSEGDEDILAACISDGMQSNISIPTASSTPTKLPMSTFNYQTPKGQCSTSGIPMVRRTPPRNIPIRNPNLVEDHLRTYLTEDTPAELSRAGSISNLSTLSIPNDSKSKVGEFSDESSNLSGENSNILEQCIQSAMPKSKKDIKATVQQSEGSVLPQGIKKSFKHHPPQIHSQANQMPTSVVVRKSDESLKMSESYNYRQRAVEKIDSNRRKCYDQNTELVKDNNQRESSLPSYLTTGDEVANYEVEDSPCHFSLRSSLSDLTVDGSVAGLKRSSKPQTPVVKDNHAAGPSGEPVLKDRRNAHDESDNNRLHRQESLSSLSSLASNEGDQALLDECIYSGMPSDRNDEALLNECIQAGMPSVRNSIINHNLESPLTTSSLRSLRKDLNYKSNNGSDGSNGSKNGNAASVAKSTVVLQPPVNEERREISTTAAGVENGLELERSDKNDIGNCGNSEQAVTIQDLHQKFADARIGTNLEANLLPDRFLHSDENFLTDLTKSGSNKSVSQILEGSFKNVFTCTNSDNCVNLDNVFTKRCEESRHLVDNRMLDPDAMIESLDRFTAELVSQASHLTKDNNSLNDKSKLSHIDDNTWNDDTSSHIELTFPTISESGPNVITFESEQDQISDINKVGGTSNQDEGISNDFSSTNTTTMTESTIIAIEASKIATVFKKEAEMSHSAISSKSFNSDLVQISAELNNLSNNANAFDKGIPRSPKPLLRKQSFPGCLLVKRALSSSVNNNSSLESLDANNISNIECTNPPTEMLHIGDMDTSITSISSLPREESELLPEFAINGATGKISRDCKPHPIFNVKQQFITSGSNSLNSDLEMVNPPSIFNDITDMCNSLADVASEVIGTETSVFEDCFTELADYTYVDNTLQNDTAEFSDAECVTPIQTDLSSAENTPKKVGKPLSKNMMTKQRRNMARDRYKTYVVAAEKVMQESVEMETRYDESIADDISVEYQTVNDRTNPLDSTSNVMHTYIVKTSKLTPKEKRQLNKSRFETQVLDTATILQQTSISKAELCNEPRTSSASPSPTKSKLSIRRSFMQKRFDNKERFKTQTLSESSFGSPEPSSASLSCDGGDIQTLVEKEANLVLKTIRDSKLFHDELLDSETLSLVSNDEESENNSGCSNNYRTYHKSWNSKKPKIPVISPEINGCNVENPNPQATQIIPSNNRVVGNGESSEDSIPQNPIQLTTIGSSQNSDEENCKEYSKPKIIKPQYSTTHSSDDAESDEQPKGIRGRRKPLYTKMNLKNKTAPKMIQPNMVSNLVKNITSTIKSETTLKSTISSLEKSTSKTTGGQVRSSGYGYTKGSSNLFPNKSNVNSRNNSPKNSPKHAAKSSPSLERQGTFTKDESSPKSHDRLPVPSSKIPSFARQVPRTSKIPTNNNATSSRCTVLNGQAKSLSADRSNKNTRIYNRSTSVDSREPLKKIQASSSTQSLKTETRATTGALKKTGIPSPAQRSKSNVSIPCDSTKKRVTSKIASLWKKVEESKTKQPVKDKRIWIQSEKETIPPKLVSNTFENNKPSDPERNSVTSNLNAASVISPVDV